MLIADTQAGCISFNYAKKKVIMTFYKRIKRNKNFVTNYSYLMFFPLVLTGATKQSLHKYRLY